MSLCALIRCIFWNCYSSYGREEARSVVVTVVNTSMADIEKKENCEYNIRIKFVHVAILTFLGI